MDGRWMEEEGRWMEDDGRWCKRSGSRREESGGREGEKWREVYLVERRKRTTGGRWRKRETRKSEGTVRRNSKKVGKG